MSFEGLLNTVGLADVLTLLATSAKTGELRVDAPGMSGRVWLKNGRLTGCDDGQGSGHPDAIFHLLGLTSGTFCFDQGTEAPAPGRPFEVGPLLVAAAHRLEQWDEIRAVIPSNLAVATMAPAAAHRHLIVSSLQWSILVAVAGGRPVGDVIRAVQLSEFEGSALLKEMVEADLIAVAMPASPVGSAARPAPGAVRSVDTPAAAGPTVAAPTVPAAGRRHPGGRGSHQSCRPHRAAPDAGTGHTGGGDGTSRDPRGAGRWHGSPRMDPLLRPRRRPVGSPGRRRGPGRGRRRPRFVTGPVARPSRGGRAVRAEHPDPGDRAV